MQNSPAAARFGDIRQLGYVVEDLATAMAAWRDEFGVGPWTVIRNIRLNAVFRGAPSRPLIDVAMGYFGPLQIELIQQRNDAPSPYRAMIDRGGFGLHHIAFFAPRIAADLRRAETQGLQMVCDIRMPMSGRYAYLQAPDLGPETYVEFLEATIMLRHMFAQGMRDAAAWDGRREGMTLDLAALPASLLKAAGNALRPARGTGQRPVPRFARVARIAYVVGDLDVAIRTWQECLGIGPWRIERDHVLRIAGSAGEDDIVRMDRARATCGDIELLLVRPHGDMPASSPYRVASPEAPCAAHHIAFRSAQCDADVSAAVARGLRVKATLEDGAHREVHLHAPALGPHVDIVLLG